MNFLSRFCALARLSLRWLKIVITIRAFAAIFSVAAFGQSQPTLTESEFAPEVDAHIQLRSQLRILALAGGEQGIGYPFQQWYTGAGLGYQFKSILRPHIENIDPDKEHYFLFGAGYEFLRSTQSGKINTENRFTIDLTPNYRLPGEFLVRDRNWIELRWINGAYLTTYRNMISVERDFFVHGFHFLPYGTAEFFYDGAKHSWNEQWYTAGVYFPYKRVLMVDTYYRRENCVTCTPSYWNVAGLSVNFYLGQLSQ
jgi:hypothetical protein